MPELSLHNIDQISRDIGSQEIVFSHLLDDLIDHVCCDVENEMQNGLSFSDAYAMVKTKMGPRRMKMIQEETLYAVDTKYRHMKKLMKISGIAGTVIFGLSALFKIQHWPLAGVLMSLGALILALVFLPSALYVLWKETHNTKRLFLFISAFFAGTFFIFGALLKVQHWPGAGIILLLALISLILFLLPAIMVSRLSERTDKSKIPVYLLGALGIIFYSAGLFFKIQHWPAASILMGLGVLLLCIIVLPWYTWLTWKHEEYISKEFIFILVGSLLIIVPGTIINLNLQNSYEEEYFTYHEQQKALYNYMYSNNLKVLNNYSNSPIYSEMETIHSETVKLLGLIGGIQTSMVKASEVKKEISASDNVKHDKDMSEPQVDYRLLSNPFHPGPVKDFLLPGCASRKEIDEAISGYIKSVSRYLPAANLYIYQRLLDPSEYLPGESSENHGISLLSGLYSLELMKNSLLTAESSVLRSISGNNTLN